MYLIKELKCILCLIKCSKYLYFAKKILCFITIGVISITVISAMGDKNSCVAKKVKGMKK